MAGALGVALAGPRRYATHVVEDPFLNAEATARTVPDDIGRALRSFRGGLRHRSGRLRRAGVGGLTAACNGQHRFDIEMRFQMIGQRVERGFDLAA